MADETKGKRTYTVLKYDPATGDADGEITSAGTDWHSHGEFDATSDKQAISMAMHDEGDDDRGGTYVAVARFRPHTVAVKPVQQTKLEWS